MIVSCWSVGDVHMRLMDRNQVGGYGYVKIKIRNAALEIEDIR